MKVATVNEDNIKFGVIIPTYNRKKLLQRALKSIEEQTYTNWIVCIVDDGSSDGTDVMVQQYIDKQKIHYIRQANNQGVNAARNAALDYLIEVRHCDFITFLDDDDYFDTNTLLEAKKIIQMHPEENWYVSKRIDDKGNDITRIDYFGTMPYIDYYLAISMDHDATHVINSKIIGNTRFSKQFKQAQEWIFFIDLAKRSNMFTYDFPSTVCNYLDDGLSAQVTQQKGTNNELADEIRKTKREILIKQGYKPASIEVRKLQHRIAKTLLSKKYMKLFRYASKYLYWKLRETLS